MSERRTPYGRSAPRDTGATILLSGDETASQAVEMLRRAGLRRKALPRFTVEAPERHELRFPDRETAAIASLVLVLAGVRFRIEAEP